MKYFAFIFFLIMLVGVFSGAKHHEPEQAEQVTAASNTEKTSHGFNLTDLQRKELTVFSGRAMGLSIGVSDVKKVMQDSELVQVVASGLNANGHLCAEPTDIHPLKLKSKYEVTCVAYRGGSAKKSYILEALNGVAFEP